MDCELRDISIEVQRNWVSNLIVSETFLTLTEQLGSAGTFLLFAGFSPDCFFMFISLAIIFL